MRAVTMPGRAELRAAVERESARRMRSKAGLPMVVLVEIADLDREGAGGAGDGTEIADVTVAADPDGRSVGDRSGVEPFVEAGGATADEGMGRRGHLAAALGGEGSGAVERLGGVWVGRHDG